MAAAELRWRAMGTDAHVIVVGGDPGLVEVARSRIAHLESLWSRFIPDSDVSRMNAASGSPVEVAPETILLVERAAAGSWLSGGAFDPLVLPDLIAAGYDRDFDEIEDDWSPSLVPAADSAPGPRSSRRSAVELPANDPSTTCSPTHRVSKALGGAIEIHGREVAIRRGAGFDSGGIGKGLAADIVVSELLQHGAEGACVNLGGDLRLTGPSPGGGGWTVAVEHPLLGEPLCMLGVGNGAVATSTTLRRRWVSRGKERHHLIDPRSGQPSDSDVELATVVAAEAAEAEVLVKALLINGSVCGFDILGGTGAEGLLALTDGTLRASEGFRSYLGCDALPSTILRTGAA